MSLIDDVRIELNTLRIDARSMRLFAYAMTAVLTVFAGLLFWQNAWVWLPILLAVFACLLVILGTFAPLTLRRIYHHWMAMALTLGWLVSRLLLTLIFCLILTPLGLLLRLAGKRLMDTKRDPGRSTYWRRIETKNESNRYEKMY